MQRFFSLLVTSQLKKWVCKLRLLSLILGAIFLFSTVISMASSMKIAYWKTDRGSEVYFVQSTALPMLDVSVVFRAGSAYDGKQWGLAAYVNSLLGQATTTKSADDIANGFDRIGASFGASTNRDMATVTLRTLTEPSYFMPALALYKEVLTRAQFDAAAVQRIKNQTLAAIQVNEQSPDEVADKVFNQTLYGDQPYGHPVIGTSATIQAITIPMIQAFYQQYYVAHNAQIILVGNIDHAHAVAIANQISDALPVGQAASTLTAMQAMNAGKSVHVNFPSQQTTIVLGQLGITRENPDYFQLMLGNAILGQLPLSSLLFQNVRNTRGLAYSATSDFDLLQYGGSFQTQLKTRVEKTDEAIQVVKQTLADFVKNGPTMKEVKMAKDYINGSFPLSTATNSAILTTVINIAFYHRPLDFMDTYLQHINAVTPEQIQAAFNHVLHPNQMILTTVGAHG